MFCRLLFLLSAFLLLPAGQAVAAEQSVAAVPDFVRDVMPALVKSGCNGGSCHGSFQGRGGFQLSLFGFDAAFDHTAITREARQRRLFVGAPEASLLLRKPLGLVPHGGGRRFDSDSAAYRILRNWIAAGAPPAADYSLHVTRLEIEPADVVLEPEAQADLQVTAHWSDGVARDVTEWAVYEVRDEYCTEATAGGRIEAKNAGRTPVTVSFGGAVGTVTVTVPYAHPKERLVFEPANYIDELVAAEWEKVGLRPVELADDYEFLRRASFDIIGTPPTPEEIREFAASTDPDKRTKLIDALLDRPEYVDYWSYRRADLLRVHRRYVGDKGLWSFWNWVQKSVRENWPMDRFTRELLAARGSLFANGATAYYFIDDDPAQLAETTSQLFLGVRLQCARCHHHPYETWSQEDYYGLANFFTRLEIKENGDAARYGGTRLLRPVPQVNRNRRVQMMDAGPVYFGETIDPAAMEDVRTVLAERITSADNPYFARNFTNRYWSYFMGRGLVEPVDDLRATNPPSHPALFEALTADFVQHGYDVRHLIRTICTSRVYQLASRANPALDRDGVFYAHHAYSRLPAPVLLDALNFATGTTEDFDGLPSGTRAISLPDPQFASYFLDAFGRSQRASPCECATVSRPDLAQALHLLNGEAIDKKLTAAKGRAARLAAEQTSDEQAVRELFLVTWSRPPTKKEQQAAIEFVNQAETRTAGLEDLLWTLLNATSFAFGH